MQPIAGPPLAGAPIADPSQCPPACLDIASRVWPLSGLCSPAALPAVIAALLHLARALEDAAASPDRRRQLR